MRCGSLVGEYLEHHPYPENIFWLIEFSNTSLAKDLTAKRNAYASANIQEYWVVDLKRRQLNVFRNPVDGDYRLERSLTDGEISPLAFPDIVVAVSRFLD
ncbi:MAG: Uma2 family endonuclease [Chamaesiphon sp. CSU_1_12]|nr:Uma2 family endonuclease [Chamaesiphon sp. CSU_1_12]